MAPFNAEESRDSAKRSFGTQQDLPNAFHILSTHVSNLDAARDSLAPSLDDLSGSSSLDDSDDQLNDTFYLVSTENFNDSSSLGGRMAAKDLPQEMVFNESHIITISAYSCLMMLSALGNISVLTSIAG